MKKDFNTSLKWKEFKDDIYNSMINPDIDRKFNTYFNNLSIQDGMFMVLFELLKQIKNMGLEIVLSTNTNETFINSLVAKMSKNTIDKIIYLNNNKAIYNVLFSRNLIQKDKIYNGKIYINMLTIKEERDLRAGSQDEGKT